MNQNDTNTTQHDEERAAGAILKLLAIIGLVAILALAAWFSVQAIRLAPSAVSMVSNVSFSSFLFPADEVEAPEVTISVGSTTRMNDEPFTLSWDGIDETYTGEFTLTYTCVEGVGLATTEGTALACEEPFALTPGDGALTLEPTVLTDESRATALSVDVFTRAGDALPEAGDMITLTFNDDADERDVVPAEEEMPADEDSLDDTPVIETPSDEAAEPQENVTRPTDSAGARSEAPAPAPLPQRETVYVPNPATRENPAGAADLGVAILATGIMQGATGGGGGGGGASSKETLLPTTIIPANERVGIRFMVQNVGDKTSSDDWYFVATLPLEGDADFTYESPTQPALGPSDKMEFVLGFDDIAADETVTIEIELRGEDDDRSDANDRDSVRTTTR